MGSEVTSEESNVQRQQVLRSHSELNVQKPKNTPTIEITITDAQKPTEKSNESNAPSAVLSPSDINYQDVVDEYVNMALTPRTSMSPSPLFFSHPDPSSTSVISESKIRRKHQKNKSTLTSLYSSTRQMNEALPLPYDNDCSSRIAYYFETFLVVHPRIYALYLLYSATWPRGLVLLDMYTDIAVAYSLYKNGQSMWFMLSSMFIILPFVLVWTVSLRFIQKFINHLYSQEKYRNKCTEVLVNLGLILYIFPPIGSIFVALYEVYLVIYDVFHGVKCFVLGTGLVETQSNEVKAMKQYRRAIEIFSESVPQTALQLYMFLGGVKVDRWDLYMSLAISTFNLLINAYRFRKEAKIHGMFIAEYALSVLQLAEIPIVRLVPRLPAIKKGNLEFINFAGFVFDKESITPIIEALNEARCVLNTMKISIGSLLNLDLESCRLMGRILKDARIRVFASRTCSLLDIKNLFEEIDDDHNGYLDEKEFCTALKSLNSGLMHMDEKQQKRIFQKLAIRRIKQRDRVYFYDFFKNTASVENKSFEFDITQMDFPLHYVFQHLIAEIKKDVVDIKDTMKSMEKLYYFCAGLNCFDQIDRSMNNHIFFTIIDTLNAIDNNGKVKANSNAEKFVMKCFHEILESGVIVSDATKLLEMRNIMFEKDIDDTIYKSFVNQMDGKTWTGLNIFEYCFAFQWHATSGGSFIHVFVHLLDLYLKTKNRYSLQQNDDELKSLYEDKDGALFHLYNASQFLWTPDGKLPIEHAANQGLFDVVEFFCKYTIKDYNEDQLYKVCVELLRNEDQNPDTFGVLLKHAQDNGMELVNIENKAAETMDIILLKTQKNIERKQIKNAINKSQSNEINSEVLRYLDLLSEYGFDFSTHYTLQDAIKTKSYHIMNHVIQICRQKSFDCILGLLNETSGSENTPIMDAYAKKDLDAITLLLECPEQDCNELFATMGTDLQYLILDKHWFIKFVYDIITDHKDIDIANRIKYESKKQLYDIVKTKLDHNELEDKSTVQTGVNSSNNVTKSSVVNNILRFRGIFGQGKNDAKDSLITTNTFGSEEKTNERVSFKQMATVICTAIKPIDGDQSLIVKNRAMQQEKKEDVRTVESTSLDDQDLTDLDRCQKMCDEIRYQIKLLRDTSDGRVLSKMCNDAKIMPYTPKQRLLFTGHFGKIYHLAWRNDNKYIVTASQDGKLILWDPKMGNKQLAITLNNAWVMTCSFSPLHNYVASGGLDERVSIFKVGSDLTTKELHCELDKHDGYLSWAEFIDENRILSASGDGTCILWDIETRIPTQTFMGHTGDVMEVNINESNPSLFVSASVDATAKVWDIRTEKSVASFCGHTSDLNGAKWFRNEYGIISGSDDGTVRLWDMRSYRQMNQYEDYENKSLHSQDPAGVTAVDASRTGQYIFSAYDNGQVYMWSSLTAEKISEMPHESRASCLQVSYDGYALATGCWDFNLRIFV
eukprot:974956_1